MKYTEVYKGVGYTVAVSQPGFNVPEYFWSAKVDGRQDNATHSVGCPTEVIALGHGMEWAQNVIDTHMVAGLSA